MRKVSLNSVPIKSFHKFSNLEPKFRNVVLHRAVQKITSFLFNQGENYEKFTQKFHTHDCTWWNTETVLLDLGQPTSFHKF